MFWGFLPDHIPSFFTLLSSLQRSARGAAENSDAVFSELIRSIELKRFEVRELIKAQEKRATGQAEQLLEKIRKDIVALKASEAELSKLTTKEDNIHFLQVQLFTPPPTPSFPGESLTLPYVFFFSGLPDPPSSARSVSSACSRLLPSPDL